MPETEAIIADFAAQLQAISTRFAGRPWDELAHLWAIALERERIVTVAYRRDIIESRLSRMPLPDDVRLAIARAIRWAWRDEERHALWIRGALLQRGRRRERARAWLTSAEGAIAGWASSRQHHHRWREAPVRRSVAEVLKLGGALTGRIPPVIRQELRWQPFRDFCAFNVAAEMTAALGWARMAEVGQGVCEPTDVAAFLQMEQDERRHAALFDLLARSLGPDDRLLPNVTCQDLLEAIGSVGQRFLSQPRAEDRAWDNPLGKGGVVHVGHASTVDGGPDLLRRLLDDAGLSDRLEGIRRARSRAPQVAIKAAFMMAVADRSPAVSPDLLRALVHRLIALGAQVTVLESGNLYDRFFDKRSVAEVAAWLGIGDLPILDALDDQAPHDYARGLGPSTLCRAWRDADLRVAFGKLRGHPTTVAMLGLDALGGLGHRHDSFLFGDRKVDWETALLMTLDAAPPDLTLVDAFDAVPDGLLGMLGSSAPRQPLRLYASVDAVALDTVLARHLGADPTDDRMLVAAALDWFGDPRARTVVHGPDMPLPGWRRPARTLRTATLSRLALPIYQHASRRGALFLPEPHPAFQERQRPSPPYRALRRAIRRLVEDRPDAAESLLPVDSLVVRGRRVRFARVGSGAPIVLVHGYPETLQIWSRLAPRLPGHTAIAFDWPGLGYSDPWPGGKDPSALADQLLEILDALGLSRVALVGADMGAQPALCLAARAPERVTGVAVLPSLLFGDGPTSPEIAVMRRTGLAGVAFGLAPEIVYRRCLRTFLPRGVRLPEALHIDMHDAFLEPAVRRHLAAMCDAYEGALPTLPAQFARVEAPVLAMWPADEVHFPRVHGERLVATAPHARLIDLPDGGHWAAWTRPDEVAAALLPFPAPAPEPGICCCAA